jgi:hypothetical protein
MEGAVVDKIAALESQGQTIVIDGKTFARSNFTQVKYKKPRPGFIEGSTLTGLVDYLKVNVEGISKDDCMIQVHDHANVSLIERFTEEDCGRTTFFKSVLDNSLPVFKFDQYMPVEEFIIKSRALMQPSDDLDQIIAIVSKVVAQNEITADDNGLAQNIQVRKGVSGALSAEASTKGMYELRPYRTFREFNQPASKFILRLKPIEGGLPQVALFDAEGGIWRYQAMLEVKKFLDEKLAHTIPVFA